MKSLNKYLIASFGLFGFLFFHLAKQMLQIRSDGWYAGHVNLYGDLLFHLSLINKFLFSTDSISDNPIYAGDKINYPPLADFVTSQIAKITGVNFALFLTTFLVGILLIFISRFFILKFVKSERVVFITLCLFLLNGGFGFFYFFRDFLTSQTNLTNFIFHLPNQYTDIKDKGYWWINNYLAYFLPQRGFLFAFPITLVILLLVYSGLRNHKIKYFLLAGILAGILPLVQAQSLLLLFLVSLFFAPATLLLTKNRKEILQNWLIFAIITAVFAVPSFSVISSVGDPLKFIKLQPGWVDCRNLSDFKWTCSENILWFWFKNLGLFAPMLIASLFWLFVKNRYLFLLYLPFLAIFFLANIFVFQPWNFDNSKLLLYWFFPSAIIVAYFLEDRFFLQGNLRKILGSFLLLIMIFAGSLDLFRTFTPVTNYQIFSKSDLEAAESVKKLTPKNTVFITASNHNHPIPALTGRSTLLGFPGWVWSHGLPFEQRSADIRKIYGGEKDAQLLLSKYKVNYVTVGPQERAEFSINQNYFEKYPKIYLGDNWYLYDVTNLWSNGNR